MADAPRKKKTWLPAILIVALAAMLVAYALRLEERSPSTDDAYLSANTIAVVPEVAGRIVELPVRDNQFVRKGERLLRIDPRSYEQTLAAAQAELKALDAQIATTRRAIDAQTLTANAAHAAVAAAQANAQLAAETLRRVEPLQGPGYASPQEVDQARTAERAAAAQLKAAQEQANAARAAVSDVAPLVAQRAAVEARIVLAQIQLDHTDVRAPFDGRIVALTTAVGALVSPLKPVFTLIDTSQWYVIANFRETDLRGMRSGTPATVYLMGDTERRFAAEVESVGYGVMPTEGSIGTALSGLPLVGRTINWVHVSQRFPVRIRVGEPDPELFRIGASAAAIVHRDRDPARPAPSR